MGIAHEDASFSFNQPRQSAEGPVWGIFSRECGGSPGEAPDSNRV